MAELVEVKKTVVSKDAFGRVIDNSFTSFVDPVTIQEDRTVEDFFNDYEALYYEIPIEGDVNSHSYLIRKSSELISVSEPTLDIQPLLDEIASLREELLVANERILELEVEKNEQQ